MNIITDFLNLRKRSVVLNGQASPLASIKAGVAQGSILGPLWFLIYINDLSGDLSTTAKFFAKWIQNAYSSVSHLNSDLSKISYWAFQWKKYFILILANKSRKLFSLIKSKRHVILPFMSYKVSQTSLFSKTSGKDFRYQIKFSRTYEKYIK